MAVPHQKFAAAVAINFENADSAAYVTKIFEIIMDEPWSIRMFSRDQKYADTLRGMDSAFDFGMRYYDQFGKPQTTDANELKEAFAYFNETLKMPKDEAWPEISERKSSGIKRSICENGFIYGGQTKTKREKSQ